MINLKSEALSMMRKIFSSYLLLVLFLSACTANTSTPVVTVTATAKPSATATATEATSQLGVEQEALRGAQVKVWHPWSGAELSLFETQVAEFNQTNEWGIVVSAEALPNYSELFTQTTAALQVNSQPQIVVALPEYALAWRQQVVDLNPYVRDPEYGLTALEVSDFNNAVWMQDEVDGVRTGVPAQRTARFIFYNQTWARELGFDSPPVTASDFETQACAAHTALTQDTDPNNDALGGWLIDAHPMTPLSWLLAFGGGVQEETGYRFLTQKNIDAFKYLKVLQQKGCAWVASPDLPVADRFATRQALFSTGSLEDLSDQSRALFAANNRDEWTVLAFPGPEQQSVVLYGSSFVMFKTEDVNQLAAWLFLRWMLQPEVQAGWVQSTGLLPMRSATLGLLGEYASSHSQWAAAVKLVPAAEIAPQLASWRLVRVRLGDGFANMFDTIRFPDLTDGQVPAVLKQMEDTASELNQR